MRSFILSITVFLSGFSIMVLEILGVRILAPYFGADLFVLTNILSAVLLCLSIGYWFGGKIADQKLEYEKISTILFICSFFILITLPFQKSIFQFLIDKKIDSRVISLIACLIILGPANILLGAISPYVAKFKAGKTHFIGGAFGNIYALGTIGSIAGTITAGFFLIPLMGNVKTIFILSLLIFINSLLIGGKFLIKIFLYLIFFILIFYVNKLINKASINQLYNTESMYQKITVTENTKSGIRNLITSDKLNQSAMDTKNHDRLVFQYTQFFDLYKMYFPEAKKFLIIGGGGYSFPKYLLTNNKNIRVDVVEIDPKITEVAQNYFFLKKDKRLRIYHQDGRVYVNNAKEKYDVVILDVFIAGVPKFHLTTQEIVKGIYKILSNNGIVISNTVGSIEGKLHKFFKAEYNTYKSIFPGTVYFPVKTTTNKKIIQNLIILGVKNGDAEKPIISEDFKKYLSRMRKFSINSDSILIDDYAPVENMFIR